MPVKATRDGQPKLSGTLQVQIGTIIYKLVNGSFCLCGSKLALQDPFLFYFILYGKSLQDPVNTIMRMLKFVEVDWLNICSLSCFRSLEFLSKKKENHMPVCLHYP